MFFIPLNFEINVKTFQLVVLGVLKQKQMQLNLCNIFSILLFNELYLFA